MDLVTRGMVIEYLSPYSPDFNPIELAFSAIKYEIRRKGQELWELMKNNNNTAAVVSMLLHLVWTVTPEDAQGWFKHCGYL